MKEEVRKSYEISSLKYMGNSNSLHSLGVNSKKLEMAAGKQILEILNLKNKEIIYTSGDSESFSLLLNNIGDDKMILTDNEDFYKIGSLMKKNIKIGDIDDFKNEDFYLISGFNDLKLEDFKGLRHICLKDKNDINNLDKYDFITIEEEEFPFFGCLIKSKNRELVPLIHGGKSSTKYRSGTSPVPLIVAFSKFIKLKYKD